MSFIFLDQSSQYGALSIPCAVHSFWAIPHVSGSLPSGLPIEAHGLLWLSSLSVVLLHLLLLLDKNCNVQPGWLPCFQGTPSLTLQIEQPSRSGVTPHFQSGMESVGSQTSSWLLFVALMWHSLSQYLGFDINADCFGLVYGPWRHGWVCGLCPGISFSAGQICIRSQWLSPLLIGTLVGGYVGDVLATCCMTLWEMSPLSCREANCHDMGPVCCLESRVGPCCCVSMTRELPRATQRIPKYVGYFAMFRILCVGPLIQDVTNIQMLRIPTDMAGYTSGQRDARWRQNTSNAMWRQGMYVRTVTKSRILFYYYIGTRHLREAQLPPFSPAQSPRHKWDQDVSRLFGSW